MINEIEYNIKMFFVEINKFGEMEFYLLEDFDFYLVVFYLYWVLFYFIGREFVDMGKFEKFRV